jgi:hypothetical protein
MDWFMERIEKGVFFVKNPFSQRVSEVSAAPEQVHAIVFWSKDYSGFIAEGFGERLEKMGYRLFFNFTVNSGSHVLEPEMPPLFDRLETLGRLCRRFGGKTVSWRFDPICFYTTAEAGTTNNLADFPVIAEAAADLGIKRCITSFMDPYAKVEYRVKDIPGFCFHYPPEEAKARVLSRMERLLKPKGIELLTCCENGALEKLPSASGIRASACISAGLTKELFGGRPSLRRDAGQRKSRGCTCSVSRDIGGYREQPCFHNCLYCYANPRPAGLKRALSRG